MDLNAGPEPQESDTSSPLERLGATLRQARLQRGIDRAALAAQLHMGDEQLQALEEADTTRLPEPVFVIAQARRVALALGVEVDGLIAPLKQGVGVIKPAPAPLAPGRPKSPARLPAPPAWIGALVLLLGLTGAGLWGWTLMQRRSGDSSPSATATAAAPAPAPARIPATTTNNPRSLTLTSAEPSWVTVETAAGKIVYEGLFNGSRRFPIGNGLKVRAGRPDLVRASLDAGAGKPLGTIDQINWVSFGAAAPAPQP